MKKLCSFTMLFTLSLLLQTETWASCSKINGFYACGPGQKGPIVCAIFAHPNEVATVAMPEGKPLLGQCAGTEVVQVPLPIKENCCKGMWSSESKFPWSDGTVEWKDKEGNIVSWWAKIIPPVFATK